MRIQQSPLNHSDSSGALSTAGNSSFRGRSKYVATRFFYDNCAMFTLFVFRDASTNRPKLGKTERPPRGALRGETERRGISPPHPSLKTIGLTRERSLGLLGAKDNEGAAELLGRRKNSGDD